MIYNIEIEDLGKRLDVFLQEKNNLYSRSFFKNMITNYQVLVNGKSVKSGYSLKLKDRVEVQEIAPLPLKATPQNIELDIVFEDEDFLIVNKPQGMVVHPATKNYEGTLVNALLYNVKALSGINGVMRPGIVHRLDKDTSGLIIIAKNDFAHVELSRQIASKICKRFYLSIVVGTVKDNGEIINYIGRDKTNRLKKAVVQDGKGKLAHSKYRVIEYLKGHTLIEWELKTGRTHQIRVHAAFMHHPILGDKLYNKSKTYKYCGQLLHAYKLELLHPKTMQKMEFIAQIPNNFEKILYQLREK